MRPGFETFNLKDRPLDATATLSEIVRLECAHLGSKGGDRSRDGSDADSSRAGAFYAEFLVQSSEELRDGKVESSL